MKNTSKSKIVWILTLRLSLAYVFFAGKAARSGGTSYYSQVGSTNITKAKVTEILDENKGISMVNPNRVYPPLPPAENIMPLMRIPEQATLCEKIGGTEYTVTAHFREDGRDLLGLLSRIFMRDTADYSFDSEGYDED